MEQKINQCIKDCSECHEICMSTAAHCLSMGGKHADSEHIKLLTDCAEICKISESFMLRGSGFQMAICDLCAEICEKCAESCDRIDREDIKMKACAEICRKCAVSCKTMTTEL